MKSYIKLTQYQRGAQYPVDYDFKYKSISKNKSVLYYT